LLKLKFHGCNTKECGFLLDYQEILVSTERDIGIIQLNRPKVLNALSSQLMVELVDALEKFDRDPDIHAIVLTGGENVFAAGADLREMSETNPVNVMGSAKFELWGRIRKVAKPLIAAVTGYCLGGGNELAMACDMIVASESASFGQPEVNVGIMPGAGGTQRLTRVVGKQKAMEMILTGNRINTQEALQLGLVNRVVPAESLMSEAKKLAHEIASKSPLSIQTAKKAILKAQDSTLEAGLEYEHSAFYSLLATEDAKEGMQAFLEKRKPVFKGK
jgi:enoyl-CoA hydratase